ncbi:MAG TPA: hypothetical protein PLL30_15785 [Candidatus Krumholzibacteria bacterium]|nr:hypothetical protein [Candidatus Krumholzibacteria bacterium]HPD73231.1 hypothetical protein [Candidatus Krumholzibacteria bacterium]HRY40193.1 hypothetical protein [Candidatus Krumholzibacteria bacterium]
MVSEREYRLRVGRVVIGLVCPDANFADSLGIYFARPSDPAAATIRLDLDLVPHSDIPAIPNSLILAKTLTADGFDIAGGLIRGRFDRRSGTGELHVKTILTSGRLTRVFEQILYQAWHSARERAGYDACLIHSAGVIHADRGFLFVGASEAGKTTVARLSRDRIVLNDEMNLVEFEPGGPRLVGTPFNGHFRDKGAGAAPLAAVLLLEHGPEHRLDVVGPGAAASAIGGQVAPPVGLDGIGGGGTTQAMLEAGSRLVEAAPVRRLRFLPDAGFWPLLTETFINDTRG